MSDKPIHHLIEDNEGLAFECARLDRKCNQLRTELDRYKSYFDKCTGLPASVGICEPVEGYAEEPSFLPSAVKAMAAELAQERERVNSLTHEIDRLRSTMVTLKSYEPVSVTVSASALSAGEGGES